MPQPAQAIRQELLAARCSSINLVAPAGSIRRLSRLLTTSTSCSRTPATSTAYCSALTRIAFLASSSVRVSLSPALRCRIALAYRQQDERRGFCLFRPALTWLCARAPRASRFLSAEIARRSIAAASRSSLAFLIEQALSFVRRDALLHVQVADSLLKSHRRLDAALNQLIRTAINERPVSVV